VVIVNDGKIPFCDDWVDRKLIAHKVGRQQRKHVVRFVPFRQQNDGIQVNFKREFN
jgi:hypothetical protein